MNNMTSFDQEDRIEFQSLLPESKAVKLPTKAAVVEDAKIALVALKLYILNFVGILTVFVVTFMSSSEAIFMVVISSLYGLMYFGLPLVVSRYFHRNEVRNIPMKDFMNGRFEIHTGVVSGNEALTQLCLVPAALLIATIAICTAVQLAR